MGLSTHTCIYYTHTHIMHINTHIYTNKYTCTYTHMHTHIHMRTHILALMFMFTGSSPCSTLGPT